MSYDPSVRLAAAPMHWRQIVAVALCIAFNALDGFDVLAISFASPGIATEWGINKTALGIVLSMELIGMAAGSVLIGNLADRVGRRPVILACLVIMSVGMFAAAGASSIVLLSAARLATGLGIGGMLSSTSALVSEFANVRRRGLAISLNIAGYSTGAVLGGLVATVLLEETGDWRWVFIFGGIATGIALPIAFALLPESINYLIARRPADAVSRISATMKKLGHPPISTIPILQVARERPSIAMLFNGNRAAVTLMLTIAYFAQIMLFYYVVKWIPKLVVDMGYTASVAGQVLVAANVGNLAGALLIGIAVQFWPAHRLVAGTMLLGCGAICAFGAGIHDLKLLSIIAAVSAFFINAGVVGLYLIMAQTYPTRLRATGIGFVIGIGRGGAAIGPVVVGALLTSGTSLLMVSIVMGAGGMLAAIMVALLGKVPASNAAEESRSDGY